MSGAHFLSVRGCIVPSYALNFAAVGAYCLEKR